MEKQKFRELLLTKKLKLTKERLEVLDEILNMKEHFDLDKLFIRLKAQGAKVSRASIYRTIPLLIESGLIEQVERVDRHEHYERVSDNQHHDHMICLKCGDVIEFYSPTLEMLQDEVCQKEKFKGMRHTLEILGHCKECS